MYSNQHIFIKNGSPKPKVAMPAEASILEANLDSLSDKDRTTAVDLLLKGKKWGPTQGQASFIISLANKASGEKTPEPESIEIGDLSKLVTMLTGTKLKWPKIRLVMDSGRKLVLSIAGPKARFPGTVNLTDGSKYGDPSGVFYGRIMQDGKFQPNARAMSHVEEVATFLMNFCMDPHAVAHAHGQKTGNCCFCARDLTDKRSVAAGYGPVCADHYGLSTEWKAAADQEEAPASTSEALVSKAPAPQIDLEGDEDWTDQAMDPFDQEDLKTHIPGVGLLVTSWDGAEGFIVPEEEGA